MTNYKPFDDDGTRVEWTIQQLKKLPDGWKLLDVGAGECRYKPSCSHLQYTAQDFCQYDGLGDGQGVQQGRQRDNTKIDIVSDITDIPVVNGSFDAVLCTEVLEHVPDPVAAIKELDRVLKKGGVMIITAPFGSDTHQSPYHFCSGFNRYFYFSALGDSYDIHCEPSGNWFEFVALEINLLRGAIEKYTAKKMKLWDRLLKLLLTMRLKHYSRISANADQLRCIRYCVVARKK